ncbi:hypothetical protein [Thorsellia anophelis]|uniref:hypothetical protein n=1 Tax=Thorsellia anophelis TaxID=336804 RepID=UPI00115F85AA|nr:hypothetical protein [Thorsellia anophelis]
MQSVGMAFKRTKSRFSILWRHQVQLISLSVSVGIFIGISAYLVLLIATLGQLISSNVLMIMVFIFVSYSFEYFHQEKNLIKTKMLFQSRLSAYLSLLIAFIIVFFNIVIISIAKDFHNAQLTLPISLEFYLYTFYALILLGIVLTPIPTYHNSLKRSINQRICQFIFLLLPVSFFSLTWLFSSYYAINGLTKTSFWFMLVCYSIFFPTVLNSFAIIRQNIIQLRTSASTQSPHHKGILFKECLFKLNLFYLICLSILLYLLAIIPNLVNTAVVVSQVDRIVDAKTEIKIDYDLFQFQTGQEGIDALNNLASYTLNDYHAKTSLNYEALKNNPVIKNNAFVVHSQSTIIDNKNLKTHENYQLDSLRLYPNNAHLPKDIYQKIAEYLTTQTDLYCMKQKSDYLEMNQGKIWLVDKPTCFIQSIHPNKLDKSFTVYAIYGYENAYQTAQPSLYLIVNKQTKEIQKFEISHITQLYDDSVAYRVDDKNPIKTPEAYERLISKHFRFIQSQFKLVEIGGKIFAISDKKPDVSDAIEVNHE